MKKSKFTGWKDVFSFTLTQNLKSRSFMISWIIMLVIAAVAMPLVSRLSGSEEQEQTFNITKAYVYDETGLVNLDEMNARLQEVGWSVTLEEKNASEYGTAAYDTVVKELDQKGSTAVIAYVTFSEGVYSVSFERSGEGEIKESELQNFGAVFTSVFDEQKMASLVLTEEQKSLLESGTETAVDEVDDSGEVIVEEDTSISQGEYWLVYGIVFFIMMCCTMAGSYVATSIVTEKSSKAVEYLLTSIRPMALIVGKVLATLLCVVMEVASLMAVAVISNRVMEGKNGGTSMLSNLFAPEVLEKLNIGNAILCLFVLSLGLIFYATLAGLAGATVSKLEEAGEGMTMFTLCVMVGAYLGIAAAIALNAAGDSAFVTFTLLFPLSSAFILPGAILVGKAQLWMILVSIALLILVIVLLLSFVSRVYEALIVYNGNRIKLKQLIQMGKRR